MSSYYVVFKIKDERRAAIITLNTIKFSEKLAKTLIRKIYDVNIVDIEYKYRLPIVQDDTLNVLK